MNLEYSRVFEREDVGSGGSFGVRIEIATDHDITEEERVTLHRVAEEVREAVGRVSIKLDATSQDEARREREALLGLFPPEYLWHAISNGYCPKWCCSHRPWFVIAAPIGVVTIGWRKSVINIDWSQSFLRDSAEDLFPSENTTKDGMMIHAWGYEKAKQYIDVLLAKGKP